MVHGQGFQQFIEEGLTAQTQDWSLRAIAPVNQLRHWNTVFWAAWHKWAEELRKGTLDVTCLVTPFIRIYVK